MAAAVAAVAASSKEGEPAVAWAAVGVASDSGPAWINHPTGVHNTAVASLTVLKRVAVTRGCHRPLFASICA